MSFHLPLQICSNCLYSNCSPAKWPTPQRSVNSPVNLGSLENVAIIPSKTGQFQNVPFWNCHILISAAGSPSWTWGACASFFAAAACAAWPSFRATIQKRYSRHDLLHIATSAMTTSDWTIFHHTHEELCNTAACFTLVLINWHFLSPLPQTSRKHEILIYKSEMASKSRFITVQRRYSLPEIWPFLRFTITVFCLCRDNAKTSIET